MGLEKDLLNKSKPRKGEQKKLFNSLSLCWWAAIYELLDKVIHSSREISYRQSFQKPSLLWASCSPSALPLLGYVQYLGDSTEAVTGIMPLFCIGKGDLPWSWSKTQLPLKCSEQFRENLDWSLTILSKVEKKFCVPKKL